MNKNKKNYHGYLNKTQIFCKDWLRKTILLVQCFFSKMLFEYQIKSEEKRKSDFKYI